MPLGPLETLLTSVAFATLEPSSWLRIAGEDRVRWLNGMVTNSIQTLTPGHGCYNFVLNAQGKIQGDCTAWNAGASILLQTSAAQLPTLTAYFDRFIIMDDVELHPLPDFHGLTLLGPGAGQIATSLGFDLSDLSPLESRQVPWQSSSILLLFADSPVVPRLELWGSAQDIRSIQAVLNGSVIPQVDALTLDRLRIVQGTPAVGHEIRDNTLPQETAPLGSQSRALHFSKGCYLGQEIVERINSRATLPRALTGFMLAGTAPAPGTLLMLDEKPVGELTSITSVGGGHIALGYLRREATKTGIILTYPGGTATPVGIPFQIT